MPTNYPPFTLIDDSGSSGNYATFDLSVVNQRPNAADRPKKSTPQCVQWTVGDDRVMYTGNVSTKTADLSTTAKCLFNTSAISAPNGWFMTVAGFIRFLFGESFAPCRVRLCPHPGLDDSS